MDPKYRGGGVGLGCYFKEKDFIVLVKSYLLKLLEPMVADLAPGELFLEKSPPNALFLPRNHGVATPGASDSCPS